MRLRQRFGTASNVVASYFGVDGLAFCASPPIGGLSVFELEDVVVTQFRINVTCGPSQERTLLTGPHMVSDIHCFSCKKKLGWKYVRNKTSSWQCSLTGCVDTV